jgi:hypothetical protein
VTITLSLKDDVSFPEEEKPEIDVRLDKDGDVGFHLKDWTGSSVYAYMTVKQFKAFMQKAEDLRNGIELAEAAQAAEAEPAAG